MRRPFHSGMLWLLLGAVAHAVVIDRIAIIVNKHVIKTSDIERDLRTTEFLNRQPFDLGPDAKRKSAERLIDQTIIREQIENGSYTGATPSEVEGMLKPLVDSRFGSVAHLKEELARYGLTEERLRMELQWQLDVLKFIDQRFRPGVLVTDEEVRAYYDRHREDLQRQFPQLKTFDAVEPKIRGSLEGERLNQNFENWLVEARKREHIEYRQGAFQ
jgi:peptidyl-prolyl cis-trans isomerase SurA